MSIVRVGLAETKNFSEGYEAIFGKKKKTEQDTKPRTRTNKKTTVRKAKATTDQKLGSRRKNPKKSSKK